MKPTLQLRLSQHLTLTPQLQQSIRLLQLSTVELNQEIERLLTENPILERDEPESDASQGSSERGGDANAPRESSVAGDAQEAASALAREDAPAEPRRDWGADNATGWRGADDDDDGERSFTAPDSPTLRDHLLTQLSLTNLDARDRTLVGVLIDALNDDGYLTQPLEEIAALLPADAEVHQDELSIALRHLQNFEPSGVGARAPAECLALQIRALGEGGPLERLALVIVEKHLGLLASRDYARLRSATGASEETLRAAHRFIRGLNPRPGAAFARVEARYVVPDVVVRKVKNVWRTSLNAEAMPRLRINRLYAELAAGGRNAGKALASQLQEARWLIKNVQQRFDTILRVSQAIVDRQRHFF